MYFSCFPFKYIHYFHSLLSSPCPPPPDPRTVGVGEGRGWLRGRGLGRGGPYRCRHVINRQTPQSCLKSGDEVTCSAWIRDCPSDSGGCRRCSAEKQTGGEGGKTSSNGLREGGDGWGGWDMVGAGAQINMESHAAAPGAVQEGDGQIGDGEKKKKGDGIRHKVAVVGVRVLFK